MEPTLISVEAICKQNFDWRLHGKNATKYGEGSYFAVNSSYSDAYAKADISSSKFMFVARVLVGSCAVGKSSYRRPPQKDPSNPASDLYDSCVNDRSFTNHFRCLWHRSVLPRVHHRVLSHSLYWSGSSTTGAGSSYASHGTSTSGGYQSYTSVGTEFLWAIPDHNKCYWVHQWVKSVFNLKQNWLSLRPSSNPSTRRTN